MPRDLGNEEVGRRIEGKCSVRRVVLLGRRGQEISTSDKDMLVHSLAIKHTVFPKYHN
jgi:hypothetical protein